PRRQIPRAAAAARRRRRRHRLFAVAGDPALGLGPALLSLGLSRPPETLADRRAPDPAARDAALADQLLRPGHLLSRSRRQRLWRQARRMPPPGRRDARQAALR